MSLFGSRAGPTAGGVSGPPAPKKMIDFSIGTKDKRPYSERVNPLIDPTHPDFIEMEKYFLAKLRDPKLNIDTILKSAFTDHEIALFTPASTPAMLAEWQADDTTRYHNILQTTFKGHVPSLQLKMAFLWFGLPVEPMRPGGYQMPWNSKTRLDFGDDKITHETEPIQFLDDWADRAHAQPGQWARKPEIFRNPPTQTFSTSLNLRGGGSDEMEVDDEEDEEEEVTGTGLPTLGVAGFEGLRVIDYTYHGFVRAVDTLLGMKYQYDYEICVEDWYDHPNAPVARATGKIYHTVGGPPTGDAIEGLLKTVMAREDVREVFVHYSKEEHPTRASPNAVEDQDVIAAQERGRPDTAYMKVPRNMSRGEIWHDLTWDYRKAIKALFPKHDHRLLAYSGDDSLTTYGAFDPDQSVWSLVADQHAQYLSGVRKMLPKVSFRVNPIPTNQVPIVFPGVYDAPVDFSGRHKSATDAPYCIHQDDLRITGKKTDEDGFKRFLAMCWRIYPELEGFVDKDFCHFSVWVTGDNFATLQDRGKHLLPRLGAQGLSEWRDIMSTWQDIGINRFLTGQSIVVRPTFYSHVVYVAGDRDRYTEAVFDDKMTLSEFKRILKDELKMTFTIDEKNDEWVITIRDDAFPRGRTPFQIHSRTNDADWVWIVRNIMGPYLSISIVRNERSPATGGKAAPSQFGPRYQGADLTQITVIDAHRPQEFREPMNTLFQNSNNTIDDFRRATLLRDRLFWDEQPSIFANPSKPSMPLHAPPIERLIKTGPLMPGISVAMLTPTEMHRLQREVHLSRNQLMDRIRVCPFMGCERFFTFADAEGLDRHLKVDHSMLKCPLCSGKDSLLPFYNQTLIRRHFLTDHYDDFLKMFGRPPRVADKEKYAELWHLGLPGPDYRYCDRCGRDQHMLNNSNDQTHHDKVCKALTEADHPRTRAPETCKSCGRHRVEAAGGYTQCECGYDQMGNRNEVGNFCTLCGLQFDDTMDTAYRQHHKLECKSVWGDDWDYCAYCRIDMRQFTTEQRGLHTTYCEKVPKDIKSDYQASTQREKPPRRCDYFNFCGVLTTEMNKHQIYDHLCWHATQGHIPHPPDAPSPPANADDQPGYPRPPEMMLPPPLHVLHMPSFNARPGNTGTAPGAPSGTSQAGGTAGVGGTTSMKPPDKNPKPPSTGPGGLFSSGLVAPTSGAAPSSTGLFDGLIPVAPATGRSGARITGISANGTPMTGVLDPSGGPPSPGASIFGRRPPTLPAGRGSSSPGTSVFGLPSGGASTLGPGMRSYLGGLGAGASTGAGRGTPSSAGGGLLNPSGPGKGAASMGSAPSKPSKANQKGTGRGSGATASKALIADKSISKTKSGPSEKAKPPKPPKPLDFGIALDDFNPGPVPAHLKRKRKNDLGGSFDSDLTFRTPTFADSEPEEEHSERSAVNDPVGNLDPDAPRSPKKRATKKNGVKSKTPVAAASGRATRAQSAAPLSTESNEGALALAATTLPKTPAAKGGSPSKKVTTSTAKTPGTASRRTRAASAQVTLPMTMESATDECEATAAAPPTTRTRTRTQVKIVEQEVVQTPATAKRGRSKK